MATVKRITTKSGPRYRVRYRDAAGIAREAWKATKDEADDFANGVERDKRDGTYFDPRAGRVKLDDYFETWIEERLVKGKPLTPATKVGYHGLYNRNVREELGGRDLRSIRPDVIRTWLAGVTKSKGSSQAAKSYRLVRSMMVTAESDGLVKANPCRIRGAGQEHSAERPLVETSLVLDLADAIAVLDPLYRCFVLLAGFAGLRTGESLGLRRRHVDLLRGEVVVEQQDQQLAGYGRVTRAPKTDAGRRVVPLPKFVVDALREHLSDPRLGTDAESYVFVSPHGSPLRRATISDAWREAVIGCDLVPYDDQTNPLGLRPHDLRHHAATMIARKPGITTKELMAIIGHVSHVAALRYQHAAEERTREVADFLDDMVGAIERPARSTKSAKVVDMNSRRRKTG